MNNCCRMRPKRVIVNVPDLLVEVIDDDRVCTEVWSPRSAPDYNIPVKIVESSFMDLPSYQTQPWVKLELLGCKAGQPHLLAASLAHLDLHGLRSQSRFGFTLGHLHIIHHQV
ncbi:hypothetical protein IF1G_09479 [Cordyceps javanica]|uniref:Uncharacterized protein n=1 Tax=Cordyceps javanica TaxID=43265 RepID=A0A545UR02_9HYPO|nr:hypothetical protein IF1G_09479 [Cordyceps javanica]